MSKSTSATLLQPGQFFGNVVDKHHHNGLVLSELRHTTGKKLAEHSHQLANFCLLLSGNYSEQWGPQSFDYKPMTVVFHPPQLTHRDEIGTNGGHFFNVELAQEWMNRLSDYSFIPERPIEARAGDMNWLVFKLFREFKSPQRHSDIAIEGLVMTMLAELSRGLEKEEKHAPQWLDKVVELLRAEFRQNLTTNFVASQVGVHPFHLSKVFRRFHHQTIGDYLKGLRVDYACEELVKSDVDLASVAIASGFADQSHFTRVFKQTTGVTPGAYRKLTRTN